MGNCCGGFIWKGRKYGLLLLHSLLCSLPIDIFQYLEFLRSGKEVRKVNEEFLVGRY